MQDYEEEMPPQASSLDDYPEPTPPEEIQEPTPPDEEIQDEEIQDEDQNEPQSNDPLWEVAKLLGVIDGTTQDARTSLGEVLGAIEALTKPSRDGSGDPLQETMDVILSSLTAIGGRMTELEKRQAAIEAGLKNVQKLTQIIRDCV